jgi:hypothetical protein
MLSITRPYHRGRYVIHLHDYCHRQTESALCHWYMKHACWQCTRAAAVYMHWWEWLYSPLVVYTTKYAMDIHWSLSIAKQRPTSINIHIPHYYIPGLLLDCIIHGWHNSCLYMSMHIGPRMDTPIPLTANVRYRNEIYVICYRYPSLLSAWPHARLERVTDEPTSKLPYPAISRYCHVYTWTSDANCLQW